MNPAVTCAIPGAKRPGQVEENARAADLPPLAQDVLEQGERALRGACKTLRSPVLVVSEH